MYKMTRNVEINTLPIISYSKAATYLQRVTFSLTTNDLVDIVYMLAHQDLMRALYKCIPAIVCPIKLLLQV